MARQLSKEMSPEEVELTAKEYLDLLAASNVPVQLDQTIADMERRVAEMNGLSVDDWKAAFGAATPAATEAPAKGKKKASERGQVVEIDPNYFWLSEQNRAIGSTWIKLRHDMNIPMHMLVVGPSGCGKTEGIKRLGEQFNLPVYKVDCASITTPDKWVGHKELTVQDGVSITEYVKSNLLKWLAAEDCDPGIVLLDEINRLPASLLNTLIPVLDGSQSVFVPELGIYSEVHPQTMIAATANLGVGYSGTYGMDIALQDRFGVVMETTFPPADEETSILMHRTGLDSDRSKILVNIAGQERGQANNGDFSRYISTRALINCAFWCAAGMKIVDASAATFLKQFSAEGGTGSEQVKIGIMVKGMAGDK